MDYWRQSAEHAWLHCMKVLYMCRAPRVIYITALRHTYRNSRGSLTKGLKGTEAPDICVRHYASQEILAVPVVQPKTCHHTL